MFHKIINNKFTNYYHFYTGAFKTTNETSFTITHTDNNNFHTAETFAILKAIFISLSTNQD